MDHVCADSRIIVTFSIPIRRTERPIKRGMLIIRLLENGFSVDIDHLRTKLRVIHPEYFNSWFLLVVHIFIT